MNRETKAEKARRLQTLEYLNSVINQLTKTGFRINHKLMHKFSHEAVMNIQDIEQLRQFCLGEDIQQQTIRHQNRGDYRQIEYEKMSVNKDKKQSEDAQVPKNDQAASEAASEVGQNEKDKGNTGSSSYDMKMVTFAQDGMKIIVKTKF